MTTLAEKVAAGRQANLDARADQKAKRSTRTNRLQRGQRFTGITIVVPLQHCVSDNDKHMIQFRQRRIVLTPEYRAAKDTIQAIARRAMNGVEPALGPVEWRAVVHFANNRRDLQNASKLLCDSFSKIVYRDDKQIKRAVWDWGENDRENPRVEITVTPREAA